MPTVRSERGGQSEETGALGKWKIQGAALRTQVGLHDVLNGQKALEAAGRHPVPDRTQDATPAHVEHFVAAFPVKAREEPGPVHGLPDRFSPGRRLLILSRWIEIDPH